MATYSHGLTTARFGCGEPLNVLFLNATVTVIKVTATRIFVGDALGGVHSIRVNRPKDPA